MGYFISSLDGMRNQRRSSVESAITIDNELATAQDYVRYHAVRFKSVLLSVCSFLVATQLSERLAYYTVVSTIHVAMYSILDFSYATATQATAVFLALVHLLSVIGSWYAESVSGHYRAIRVSYAWILVGLGLCTVAFIPDLLDEWTQRICTLVGLYGGVAIGTGLHTANLVVLGAEQFDATDSVHIKERGKYLRYVYWSIKIGAGVAFGYVAYVALIGQDIAFNLGPEYGFVAAYGIAIACIILSGIIFYAGRSRYFKKYAEGSILIQFWRAWGEIARDNPQFKILRWGLLIQIPAVLLGITSIFFPVDGLWSPGMDIAIGSIVISLIGLLMIALSKPGIFKCSDTRPTYLSNELLLDLDNLVLLMPLFVSIVPFWIAHSQMFTTFISQGCQLKQDVFDFTFSPPQLLFLSTLAMLLLSPIIDCCTYRYGFSRLARIKLGLFVSSLAVAIAGFIEIERLDAAIVSGPAGVSTCGGTQNVSDLALWYQIPQYGLMGVAEVLTIASVMDYAFLHSPPSMRTVVMAMFYLSAAIGYHLCGVISQIGANVDHSEYQFFAISGFCLLNCVFFMIRMRKYKETAPEEPGDLISPNPSSIYSLESVSTIDSDLIM